MSRARLQDGCTGCSLLQHSLMPPGIKSPQIRLSVKPVLGRLNTATLNCLTADRHTPRRLQAAAVPMHPWSLRNKCSSSSTPSLPQGVKLPVFGAAPHVLKQLAEQAKPDSVWHAVDLQEDSTSPMPSTADPTKAAAQAFQVQSVQQLQVNGHNKICITFCYTCFAVCTVPSKV